MTGADIGCVVDSVEVGAGRGENSERFRAVVQDGMQGGLDGDRTLAGAERFRRIDGTSGLFDEETHAIEQIQVHGHDDRVSKPGIGPTQTSTPALTNAASASSACTASAK